MNKYDSLIAKIGNEYNIKKGKTELINDWKVRIIYSLLGRMAAASLFDDIDGEIISIIHMKNRISSVFDSYREMYPELSLPKEADNLADEIYDIFSHTGIFYHMPNRIVAASKTEDIVNNIIFTRGYELSIRQEISGLGTYLKLDDITHTQPYRNIFHLDMTYLKDRWQLWTEDVEWREFKVEGDIEYLRINPPFLCGYGYWVNKPNTDGRISLLRAGFKGNKLYYLYTVNQDRNILVSQLPAWLVENYNYRSLANACLYYKGVLPPVSFRYDGDIVYFKFGYLPPPAELYLWKLYSWPTSILNLPKDFSRICTRCVFDNIVELMKMQGYEFIEEK